MKIAYTIATINYLAQAKTLADSFIEHNPDYKFVIGLADKINGRFKKNEFAPHEILEVDELEIPYFNELCERYDMFELSNALKPFYAGYFFTKNHDIKIVVYADGDMMAFDRFDYVEECLKDYAICITPHILTTIPKDEEKPSDNVFLVAGVYNGGFFALNKMPEAMEFIKWWKEKLRYFCFNNANGGLFVDQLWLNFVPIFFNKVFILKHPGYNVAQFNLHERFVSFNKNKYWVNEKYPLVLYHYTGYNPKKENIISDHQSRYSFIDRPDIKPLTEIYRKKLMENKYDYFITLIPYYKELKEKNAAALNTLTTQHSSVGFLRRVKRKLLN